MSQIFSSYLERHGYCPPGVAEPPAAGLGLVVVIPALAEPDLPQTLRALWAAEAPSCAVEVIVVINAGQDATEQVRRRNVQCLHEARAWAEANPREGFRLHVLDHPALPARHAGVGLARKIGMDEAAARLDAVGKIWGNSRGNAAGIIAGLDADCGCAPNYLRAVERYFERHPASPACSIYFEHDFSALRDPLLRAGIVHYELFLRYYNLGLKFAGHPYAFHTLGSCMAVRADAYLRQGGMNRRKAAEDFYFLGKFMALGNFSEIRDTVVYPSARVSGRVPFGTGKAMGRWRAGGGVPAPAYHPAIFAELAGFMGRVDELYDLAPSGLPDFMAGLPTALKGFLHQARFAEVWAEMRANCATSDSFNKRFFRWFDRFRVLKYVHFADGRFYPRLPLTRAYTGLMAWRGLAPPSDTGERNALEGDAVNSDAEVLLHHARQLEREGAPEPSRAGGEAGEAGAVETGAVETEAVETEAVETEAVETEAVETERTRRESAVR